jgi:hypothetical protein
VRDDRFANPTRALAAVDQLFDGVHLRVGHGYDVLVHDERLGIMVPKASLSPTPSRAITGLWCHWVPCCFPLSLCG